MAEQEAGRSLLELPFECTVELLSQLSLLDLASAAVTCRALRDACEVDYLWRNLCMQSVLGNALDFREATLRTLAHPDAKGGAPDSRLSWRDVFRRSRAAARTTICIDVGRGYAKYGLASLNRPREIQICHPGAEATQESVFGVACRRLGLSRQELSSYNLLVAEPFALAAREDNPQRTRWRRQLEKNMLAREGFGRLCIVDAASLCLFAHQLTSGVVVNIGFGQTFVVPVVDGRVIRDAVVSMRVGGMDLTQMMAQLFQVRGIRLRWTEEMQGEPIQEVTVARNLKERGCEVYPTTLRDTLGCAPYDLARVLGRDDAPYKEVALGGARFSLGWERYLPAELLFGRCEFSVCLPGGGGGGAVGGKRSLFEEFSF